MPVLDLGEETHDVSTLSRFSLVGLYSLRAPTWRNGKTRDSGSQQFVVIRGRGFKPLDPQIQGETE